MQIGLLSDTHSFLNPKIFHYFEDCDEIWHAGDIGNPAVAEKLSAFKPFRAVYGNIDSHELRLSYPESLFFEVGGVHVLITHIGGYPNKYPTRIRQLLSINKPDLFICGHSHNLKIMPDHQYNLLHINPGAAGKEGFHKVSTLVKFQINKAKKCVENVCVIELIDK